MENYIKTSLKDIKVIIFDFDETLYYSSNIRDYYINYIFNTIKTLTKVKDWTDDDILNKMAEIGFTKENKTSPSFTSSCNNFGVEREDWNNYKIDNTSKI